MQELRKAIKRRRALLLFTPLFFVSLSIAAIYLIEPKYTSSASIYFEKGEALDPMAMFDVASSEEEPSDPLLIFEDIIYSRATVESVIDSLGFAEEIPSNAEKQILIRRIRESIEIESESSDTFVISFTDADPEIARAAADNLARHFIETRVSMSNRLNKERVDFFTNRLQELEQMVAEQRNQQTEVRTSRMRESPMDLSSLQSRLERVESEFETLEWDIYQEEQRLAILREFESHPEGEKDFQVLYRLSLEDLPYGENLDELLTEHDELRQQFTENYPRLRTVSRRIEQLVERIPPAIESNLTQLASEQAELSQQRTELISDMEQSFIANQRETHQQSDFTIYEDLYNDIKVKLEQARMTQELGSRSSEQFSLLAEPVRPESPSSPQTTLLIAAGLMLGMIFGVVAAAVAEVLDTTVRDVTDLQYEKPVIAYLTHG